MLKAILKFFGLTTISNTKYLISQITRDVLRNHIQERVDSQYHGLSTLIGKPVITFGNEWTPMIVGELVAIEQFGRSDQTPLPVIKSYITGDNVISFGHLLPYSDKMLDTLMKLTPYERWNITAKHCYLEWDKPKLDIYYAEYEQDIKSNLITIGIYREA